MTQSLTTSPAIEGSIVALARCMETVDQFTRAGGCYRAIGPHLRHCLDHVSCFTRGLANGVVEYDARDRDPRLETDAETFREAVRKVLEVLLTLEPAALSRVIHVRQIPAPGHDQITVQSTVERELLFLSGHTIHHCAIISQIAKMNGIELSVDHGVAFSTAAHRAGFENH